MSFADLALSFTAVSPDENFILYKLYLTNYNIKTIYFYIMIRESYFVRYSASCKPGSSRELGATMNGSSLLFDATDAA